MSEEKPKRCAWVGCSQPVAATIEKRELCVEHFLEMARQRLDAIEKAVNDQTVLRAMLSEIQSVLSEILSQTPAVVAGARRLRPEMRDSFMSLSEKAARLYKQARRPPRFDRSVSCHIRMSVLSSEAPQKCATLNVSQRGASVETTQAFQTRQVVTLQREDTGKRANAQVVWVKKKATKGFTVGLEILDEDDFWGLGPAHKSGGSLPPFAKAPAEAKAAKKAK